MKVSPYNSTEERRTKRVLKKRSIKRIKYSEIAGFWGKGIGCSLILVFVLFFGEDKGREIYEFKIKNY